MVAFFHSSSGRLRRHLSGRGITFRVAADPGMDVYRRYGVETSWSRFVLTAISPRFYWEWIRSMWHGYWGGFDWRLATMPADFLVGPDGRVLRVHYGKDIGDHMPLVQIEKTLTEGS